ncbi:uncharacterized protein LOC132797166 [Drosophila nasuta]|uniref:Uncharacterized protein LOC117575179 n=1 Tax=Drosophila albomicans TaxID=7291 RepID=A0A6P8XPW0_DROAB|nr:uncharacterized protein LOC117575179 [Drosophila albomicans]XP_060664693.1 uncharacterized protein LOC132797166 [Drosophila nasuta]
MLPVTIVLCSLVLGAHLILVLGLKNDLEGGANNVVVESDECKEDDCPCATSSLGCPAVVRALPCKQIDAVN